MSEWEFVRMGCGRADWADHEEPDRIGGRAASTYEVTIVGDAGETCFTATVTPASWTARDAQELATDISRCLKPGHTVTAGLVGSRDEGVAKS